MIEAVVTQTTIAIFSRPFAETYSSSAPVEESIPDALRRAPGAKTTPTEIEKFVGSEPSQAWFWTEDWQVGEREAQEDIAARRGDFFDDSDSFLESL